MSRFEIAFSGQLVAGARPEVVKANLAKLFQADAQRIELLFSGRRVVIKNNLDAASAEKYRSVLERRERSPWSPRWRSRRWSWRRRLRSRPPWKPHRPASLRGTARPPGVCR